MSNRWMKAAVRYEAAKLSGFKPSKKQLERDGDTQTLAEFTKSLECREAQALLTAASRFVALGRTGVGKARTHVLFSSRGLEKRTSNGFERISTAKANKLLSYIHDGNSFFDPVLCIREELDRIADEAP